MTEAEKKKRNARIAECDRIREKQMADRMREDSYARAGFPK